MKDTCVLCTQAIYVRDLDMLMTVQLMEDSPVELSLGKL